MPMSPGRRVNKIQKQLEYYFSTQNMDSDSFLRESMDGNGWVHIDVIMAFNRMNVLGATKELVVEAAFHSTNIEVDTKNPDRIRMTKLWKEYVRKNKEKKRREARKKQKEKEEQEAKEKEEDTKKQVDDDDDDDEKLIAKDKKEENGKVDVGDPTHKDMVEID